MVEDDERAEAEAYPPREVRLVQARDPCARREHGLERAAVRRLRRRAEWEEERVGTEGEAEDGEVDLLLRRVRIGDADAGAGGRGNAAAGPGPARRSRAWKEPGGGGVERAWGEERHGAVGVREIEMDW